MTSAECEIVADAACHLKAIEARLEQWENRRAVVYVLGLLASLPLSAEDGTPEQPFYSQNQRRICSTCGRSGLHFYKCEASHDEPKHSARV